MKATLVKIVLLLSLSFNVVHATVITAADNRAACHHATAIDFVLETHDDDACGDLCKLHHYFHFVAILDRALPALEAPVLAHKPQTTLTTYTPTSRSAEHKPPILS